jgi:hypothetical protein
MRGFILVLLTFPALASAQMYKCFDGVRPKYTYQNAPCEEAGLKTAKVITNKDALIGSADFSGYRREEKVRAEISRQTPVRQQSTFEPLIYSARPNTGVGCEMLLSRKRGILAAQRQKSTAELHEAYRDVTKKMQAIDCQGV